MLHNFPSRGQSFRSILKALVVGSTELSHSITGQILLQSDSLQQSPLALDLASGASGNLHPAQQWIPWEAPIRE